MSYYVYGSSFSYNDYLQAKSFVKDITSKTGETGRAISMEIASQTRNVIASNEALSRNNIIAMEAMADSLSEELYYGFDQISHGLRDISIGISELNSTFHWGFSQVIASMGHMNDVLSELIKIAKTPIQTVAYNHFAIARDAFRQGLYRESLEEVRKATHGDHTSPGYKIEWRFHQLVGTICLGFVDCEFSLIDLTKAEESFLLAARYAKIDYPIDASKAYLSAGWSAYCLGKMLNALEHTKQAIELNPMLAEALFQAAKIHMALGQVKSSLPILAKAIDLDRFYALKAAADGDFKKFDEELRNFIETLRQRKYKTIAERVQNSLHEAASWLSRNLPEDQHLPCVVSLIKFLDNKNIPLIDLLETATDINKNIDELYNLNKMWKTLVESHKTIRNNAQLAINEVDSFTQSYPEFDPEYYKNRIEIIQNEDDMWPILIMDKKLESRKYEISSIFNELRKSMKNILNNNLREKENSLNKTISLIKERYLKTIDPQVKFKDIAITLIDFKMPVSVLIIITFAGTLGSWYVLIEYLMISSGTLLFIIFLPPFVIYYLLHVLCEIPKLIMKNILSRIETQIDKQQAKRDDEINTVRQSFNNDYEVIQLTQKLKDLQTIR